jgi:hypothetical protein
MTRSQAGSPTAQLPKSMTACNRPASTSRLPGARSPCTQTGDDCQGDATPAAHTVSAAPASISPARIFETDFHLGIVDAQASAPMEAVLARLRSCGGIEPMERPKKASHIAREGRRITELCTCRRLALDPSHDRPVERVAGTGIAQCDRLRDQHRQAGGEPRKYPLFLLRPLGVSVCRWEADGHLVAQPERPVAPSAWRYRGDWQMRPVRKLIFQKAPYGFRIYEKPIIHAQSCLLDTLRDSPHLSRGAGASGRLIGKV